VKRAPKVRHVIAAAALALVGWKSCKALTTPAQAASASASSCGVGSWSTGAPAPSPRVAASLLVLDDGRVLRAGGDGAEGEGSTKVELYDPARDTWQSLPPMHLGRRAATLVQARDGRVLAVGGGEDWQSDYRFEVLDAALSSWQTVESPLATWVATAGRKADGTIVLAGEKQVFAKNRRKTASTIITASSAIELDPVTLEITRRMDGTEARQLAKPEVLASGEVAFIGGEVPGSPWWPGRWLQLIQWRKRRAHRDVEWIGSDGSFEQSASAPRSFDFLRDGLAVELAPRQLLVVGTRAETMFAYRFDLQKNKVRAVPSPRAHGYAAEMVKLADGSALLVGGTLAPRATECFDPARGTWTSLPEAPSAGPRRTGTVLRDGRALFVGDDGRVDIYSPSAR
jgi:hypothetical protein